MNELYLVCPFSNCEHFVRNHLNPNAYFYTVAGNAFRLKKEEHAQALAEFIQDNDITGIILVGDEDCRFARAVVQGKGDSTFFMHQQLNSLYKQHFDELIPLSESERCKTLVQFHLQRQKDEITAMLALALPENEISLSVKLINQKSYSNHKTAQFN